MPLREIKHRLSTVSTVFDRFVFPVQDEKCHRINETGGTRQRHSSEPSKTVKTVAAPRGA